MIYVKYITLPQLRILWGFNPPIPNFTGDLYVRVKKDGAPYNPKNPQVHYSVDMRKGGYTILEPYKLKTT